MKFLLGITNLYNSMILSILSTSFHGFAFGFFKWPIPMEIMFLTSKPMIYPLISRCETTILNNLQQSVLLTKYTIKPSLRPPLGALKQSTNLWDSQFLYSTLEDSMDMANLRTWLYTKLGITNFYNGMILSTSNVSTHEFVFSFPKMSHTNGDSVFYL